MTNTIQFFAIGVPSGMELLVIGLILVFLFGGAKLPGLARSLGQSIVEFKKGVKGKDDEDDVQQISGDPPQQLPKDAE